MRLAVRPALGRLGAAEVTILVASAIGTVGIMWFPGQMGAIAGSGTEIAALLHALAIFASLAATVAVVRSHPGQRTTALVGEVIAPAAAAVVSIGIAVLDLALSAIVLSASAVTITVNFLPLTPLWALDLLLLFPAGYGAALGLEALARALNLAGPVTLLVLCVTCLFAAVQAHYGNAVLPRVPAVGGWPAILTGSYAGVWAIGGLTIVPNICAQIAHEQRHRLPARVLWGAAIAFALGFGLLVLDLAVMGVTGLSWYEWPTVSMLRQTSTEAFLINRVSGLDEGVLVVMVWAFVGLHLWNASVNISDALAPPSKRSARGPDMPWRNRFLGGALCTIVFAVCRFVGTGSRLDDFAQAYLDPAVVLVAVALPVTLWAVDRVRRASGRRARA
jgi:hypothetical protein